MSLITEDATSLFCEGHIMHKILRAVSLQCIYSKIQTLRNRNAAEAKREDEAGPGYRQRRELRKHRKRISSEKWFDLSKEIEVGMIGRIIYFFSKPQSTRLYKSPRVSIITTKGGPRK